MKKILISLVLLTFFCISAFAQQIEDNHNQANEWVRLQNDKGEFSFEIPADFVYFYDKDGFTLTHNSASSFGSSQTYQYKEMKMFSASSGKTVMSVEIYEAALPKKYLDELIESQNFGGSKSDDSKDGFVIKQIEQNEVEDSRNKKDVEISHVTKFIASKKRIYVLTVANRGAKTAAFERFLSSVSLNSEQTNSSGSAKTVSISSLTPITIGQLGEVAEQTKDSAPSVSVPNKPIEKIENPILFLARPRVSYTEAARKSHDAGTIRLRLKFSKKGRISKIIVLSSLPNGLMRNAVFSALRMKYIPQEKDNELVDTTNVVEYNFSIY